MDPPNWNAPPGAGAAATGATVLAAVPPKAKVAAGLVAVVPKENTPPAASGFCGTAAPKLNGVAAATGLGASDLPKEKVGAAEALEVAPNAGAAVVLPKRLA